MEQPDASSGASGGDDPHPPAIRPSGDIRFALEANRIDLAVKPSVSSEEAPTLAFAVRRANLGFKGKLSDRLEFTARINVVEERGRSSYKVMTDAGATGTVTLPDSVSGWSARPRELYADIDPTGSGAVRIRAGVEPDIFSVRDWFDEPEQGFYLVTEHYEEVGLLAGLYPSRDLGVSGTLWMARRRGRFELMAANGTGTLGGGEDNLAKSLSARLTWKLVDGLDAAGSVLTNGRGTKAQSRENAYSLSLHYDQGPVRLMGEFLAGEIRAVNSSAGNSPFIGLQAAAGWSLSLGGEVIDRVVPVLRYAYFDPYYVKDQAYPDALAWAQGDLGVQTWWKTHEGLGFMTGVGYELYVPMDATLPIEHRALAESQVHF